MDEIFVSVVLPVKNGEPWLNETLPAILKQRVNGKLEVLAIDSGSTDKTLQILANFSVRVINIAPNEFNHGLTRNLGAREARGEYVVMTVQDAKPVSDSWLQNLISGFVDETVVAVCGQQIVVHDIEKNPVEWSRPISKPELRKFFFPLRSDFERLSPAEQLSICKWDDVNAMYKREVLLQIPFRKTDFAEDALWAKDALLAGYAIVYNPVSQVEHYHSENYQFAFQRNFIVQYHFYKYFGVLPSRNRSRFVQVLRNIKILLRETDISLAQKLKWLRYNLENQKAVDKSNSLLLNAIEKGEKIDGLYKTLSTSIPQASKISSNSE